MKILNKIKSSIKDQLDSLMESVFNKSENLLKIEIAKWLSERIKSVLRNGSRYEVTKQQLLSMIEVEFKVKLSDLDLYEVIKECSYQLYLSKVKLYADNGGIVAGKPMKEAVIV